MRQIVDSWGVSISLSYTLYGIPQGAMGSLHCTAYRYTVSYARQHSVIGLWVTSYSIAISIRSADRDRKRPGFGFEYGWVGQTTRRS